MAEATQKSDEGGATQPDPRSEEAAIRLLNASGQPAEAEKDTETSTEPEDDSGAGDAETQDASADDADPDAAPPQLSAWRAR